LTSWASISTQITTFCPETIFTMIDCKKGIAKQHALAGISLSFHREL